MLITAIFVIVITIGVITIIITIIIINGQGELGVPTTPSAHHFQRTTRIHKWPATLYWSMNLSIPFHCFCSSFLQKNISSTLYAFTQVII